MANSFGNNDEERESIRKAFEGGAEYGMQPPDKGELSDRESISAEFDDIETSVKSERNSISDMFDEMEKTKSPLEKSLDEERRQQAELDARYKFRNKSRDPQQPAPVATAATQGEPRPDELLKESLTEAAGEGRKKLDFAERTGLRPVLKPLEQPKTEADRKRMDELETQAIAQRRRKDEIDERVRSGGEVRGFERFTRMLDTSAIVDVPNLTDVPALEKIPVFGQMIALGNKTKEHYVKKRIKQNAYSDDALGQAQREADIAIVQADEAFDGELSKRGTSWRTDVAAGIGNSAGFMYDLMAAGPAKSLTKATMQGARWAQRIIPHLATAGRRGALRLPGVVAEGVDRMTMDGLQITPEGKTFFENEGEGWLKAFSKAIATEAVAQLSEASGEMLFGPMGDALARRLPASQKLVRFFLGTAIENPQELAANPNMLANIVSGVFPEWLEERMEGLGRAVFNLDERPGVELTTKEQWKAILPGTMRDALVELGVLGVIKGAASVGELGKVTQRAADAARRAENADKYRAFHHEFLNFDKSKLSDRDTELLKRAEWAIGAEKLDVVNDAVALMSDTGRAIWNTMTLNSGVKLAAANAARKIVPEIKPFTSPEETDMQLNESTGQREYTDINSRMKIIETATGKQFMVQNVEGEDIATTETLAGAEAVARDYVARRMAREVVGFEKETQMLGPKGDRVVELYVDKSSGMSFAVDKQTGKATVFDANGKEVAADLAPADARKKATELALQQQNVDIEEETNRETREARAEMATAIASNMIEGAEVVLSDNHDALLGDDKVPKSVKAAVRSDYSEGTPAFIYTDKATGQSTIYVSLDAADNGFAMIKALSHEATHYGLGLRMVAGEIMGEKGKTLDDFLRDVDKDHGFDMLEDKVNEIRGDEAAMANLALQAEADGRTVDMAVLEEALAEIDEGPLVTADMYDRFVNAIHRRINQTGRMMNRQIGSNLGLQAKMTRADLRTFLDEARKAALKGPPGGKANEKEYTATLVDKGKTPEERRTERMAQAAQNRAQGAGQVGDAPAAASGETAAAGAPAKPSDASGGTVKNMRAARADVVQRLDPVRMEERKTATIPESVSRSNGNVRRIVYNDAVTGEQKTIDDYEGFPIRYRRAGRVVKAEVVDPARLPFTQSPVGSNVSMPYRTYAEATQSTMGNPWVRQSADADNSGRVLLVQFSSPLLQKSEPGIDTTYYDKLYGGMRQGYVRGADFWEVPQWIAFASNSLPNADLYVVRSMDEAKRFLSSAGYGHVAFSALDVNAPMIDQLVPVIKGKVAIGGYTDMDRFRNLPNVKVFDALDDFIEGRPEDDNGFSLGMEYLYGTNYRLFHGMSVIPRLTMSDGCLHNCDFCIVPKDVVEVSREGIIHQVESFAALKGQLIYLNDKTFGQASNYTMLPELYQIVKAANPDFIGFVVQTSAAQMKRFTDEFLQESGIAYIELGMESFNDSILKAVHKPANQKLLEDAAEQMRRNGIVYIPNVMIGLPGENAQTYANTLDYLRRNADIISHANIYNFALYKDSALGKKLKGSVEADFDENVNEKSFHAEHESHRQFQQDVFQWGIEQLGREVRPMVAEGEVGAIRNMRPRQIAITPEQDAAYMTAVEAGDTATAQRMVDEAAKAAGYADDVYHGTVSQTQFNKFRAPAKGIWSAFDEAAAEPGSGSERVRVMRLKADRGERPVVLNEKDAREWQMSLNPLKWMRDFRSWEFVRRGYLNPGMPPTSVEVPGYALVVFSPEQLKTSDPVTRDGDRVIPLSERFNPETGDIRFKRSEGNKLLDAGSISSIIGSRFAPVSRAMDVYISDVPMEINAQSIVNKQGVQIRYNSGRLSEMKITEEQLTAIMREELLHSAVHKAILNNKMDIAQEYVKIFYQMTKEERNLVGMAYAGEQHENVMAEETYAGEFVRMLLQRKLYGQMTEEVYAKSSAVQEVVNLVKLAVQYLKDLVSSLGANAPREMDWIIREAEQIISSADPESESIRFKRAWHGTPHTLEPEQEKGYPHGRFRLDKIGTGEGAQAYGWGIYFADAKGVSESYAVGLKKTLKYKGEPVREVAKRNSINGKYTLEKAAILEAFVQDDIDAAIKRLRDETIRNAWDGKYERKEMADWLDQNRKQFTVDSGEASLYHLDIPDEILPVLMDWDTTWEKQTPEFRKAFYDANFRLPSTAMTMGQWYQWLARQDAGSPSQQGDNQKAVSEMLREAGILGLRYLDQDSRPRASAKYPDVEIVTADEYYRLNGEGDINMPRRNRFFVLPSIEKKQAEASGEPLPSLLYTSFANSYIYNPVYGYKTKEEAQSAIDKGMAAFNKAHVLTHNYVLWDQPTLDKIALLERNGQALDTIRNMRARREQQPPAGVNVEVAPDPKAEALNNRWRALPLIVRDEATRKIAAAVLPRMLHEIGIDDVELEYTRGTFEGNYNPTIIMRFTPQATWETKRRAAIASGALLRQQAVIVFDEGITEGDNLGSFFKVVPDRVMTDDEMSALNDGMFVDFRAGSGLTLRDGSMVFGNFTGYSDSPMTDEQFRLALSAALDKHIPADVTIDVPMKPAIFRSEYIDDLDGAKGPDGVVLDETLQKWYGALATKGDAEDASQVSRDDVEAGGDDLRKRIGSFRSIQAEAESVLNAFIEGTPGADQRAGEAGDAAPDRGGEGGTIRNLRADRKAVVFHWGREGLTETDPTYQGTGSQGAERNRRFNRPKDYVPRTYFGGAQYAKTPEFPKGTPKYSAELDTSRIVVLGDLTPEEQKIWARARAAGGGEFAPDSVTFFEKGLKRAGYLGWYDPDADVYAIFDKVPVKPVGAGRVSSTTLKFAKPYSGKKLTLAQLAATAPVAAPAAQVPPAPAAGMPQQAAAPLPAVSVIQAAAQAQATPAMPQQPVAGAATMPPTIPQSLVPFNQAMHRPNKVLKGPPSQANAIQYIYRGLASLAGNISKDIAILLRSMEQRIGTLDTDFDKAIMPLSHRYKKLSEPRGERRAFDSAVMQGEQQNVSAMLAYFGIPDAEYLAVRERMDFIENRARDLGLKFGHVDNYWSRKVKDYDGLRLAMEQLYGITSNVIDSALAKAEHEKGAPLTEFEQGDVLTAMVHGNQKSGGLGNLKERKLQFIPDELQDYYEDSMTTAMTYAHAMHEQIAIREFLGKMSPAYRAQVSMARDWMNDPANQGVPPPPQVTQMLATDFGVGRALLDLHQRGVLDAGDVSKLNQILSSRFAPRHTPVAIRRAMNATMGMFLVQAKSTIRQLQDLHNPVSAAGAFWGTVGIAKSASRNLLRVKPGATYMRLEDLGVSPSDAWKRDSVANKAIEMGFNAIGFSLLDRLGKEALVNAKMSQLRSLATRAQNGSLSAARKLDREVFRLFTGMPSQKVKDRLAATNVHGAPVITDESKQAGYQTLAIYTPISRSEMPLLWQKGGMYGAMYQFKSYLISFHNAWVDMGIRQLKEAGEAGDTAGQAEAIRNMVMMPVYFTTFGFLTSMLIQALFNRDDEPEEVLYGEFLQTLGSNRYMTYKAKVGEWQELLSGFLMPALSPATDIGRDVADVVQGKIDQPLDMRMARSFPGFGSIIYAWYGRGSKEWKAENDAKRKAEAKENPSKKSGSKRSTTTLKLLSDD